MERAKRDCIIEAAARAFSKLGFKKASIDQIARDAGVAKGTVYLACESKEDLFYQAVHRDLRGFIGEISKRIDPRVPADELLVAIATDSIRYMRQRPLVRGLISGIYHGELPGWAARFEELRALAHANIVEILRLGIRQKVFRADLDVQETASLLQDFQNAGTFHMAQAGTPDPRAIETRMRAGLDLVLNGLRTRGDAAGA